MRMFLVIGLATACVFGTAAWFAPVVAQDGSTRTVDPANPHNLPATGFGTEGGGHGFNVPPGFADASVASNPAARGAKAVGQAVCTACHSREEQNFAHTTHALGMGVAHAANPNTPTCEACHGPGSAHAENPVLPGAIINFAKGSTPVKVQTASCLGCHTGGPRDKWTGSIHQRNQLSCSDCHNPMAQLSAEGLEAKQSINETCATCHKDIRLQFNRRSHMPLPEGQLSCVDCHNPHGTINTALLKTDTVNETCYQCHAEKRGPFLFEHAPVRENCLNCHTPHGSNQHALLVAPVPMLCQQCHSNTRHPNDMMNEQQLAIGRTPDERVMGRGCLTCHAQIHGSNNPAGPRLHK